VLLQLAQRMFCKKNHREGAKQSLSLRALRAFAVK